MKPTGLFYCSFAALLFLLLLMSRHAYADQMLSLIPQDNEGIYILQAENVTGQIDSIGTRLDLPDDAQVTNVELTALFEGGFLSWVQQEDKLFLIAAPPEGQTPTQDTHVANIYIKLPNNATIADVTIEESNQVGWQGNLVLVSVNGNTTPTVTTTPTIIASPSLSPSPTATSTPIMTAIPTESSSVIYLPLVIN